VRIVIVDDQPVSRKAVREVLERRGHSVVGEAADGADALNAVADLEPDAVLLDVRVGGESGFEIARRLTGAHRTLAVVLTSVDPATSPELARASGARAFVPKTLLHTVDLAALVAPTPSL